MKRSRFREEQAIGVLKEHQAAAATTDLCRKHGVSDAMFPNPAPKDLSMRQALVQVG